ncbi:MAG: hypothetical protein EHM49_04125, partial [Deltaproteobacteria bacterium]
MTLTEALDRIYEGKDSDMSNWHNPIRPYFISGITQTPYEAYVGLKPEYQALVCRWLGHEPKLDEE